MVFSPAHWCQTKIQHSSSCRSRWFGLSLLVLILVLGSFYVISVNSLATKGYEIRQLKSELDNVRQATHKLEVDATNLQSLKTIEDGLPASTFVAVERIEYLASTGSTVGVAVK